MNIRSLSVRLARIEAQRDNRTYQAAWGRLPGARMAPN